MSEIEADSEIVELIARRMNEALEAFDRDLLMVYDRNPTPTRTRLIRARYSPCRFRRSHPGRVLKYRKKGPI